MAVVGVNMPSLDLHSYPEDMSQYNRGVSCIGKHLSMSVSFQHGESLTKSESTLTYNWRAECYITSQSKCQKFFSSSLCKLQRRRHTRISWG